MSLSLQGIKCDKKTLLLQGIKEVNRPYLREGT
jgi:hypothetical protein